MADTASADHATSLPLDLDLDDEQQQLLEATRGFIKRNYPLGAARQVIGSPRELDRDLWRESASMGWIATLVPERAGGFGFDPALASVISSELGRGVGWPPFMGCALAAAAIQASADSGARADEALVALATGELTGAWCGSEPSAGSWGPTTVGTSATKRAEGFRLSGTKNLVVDADLADLLVVAARLDDGIALFLVSRDLPGVSIEVNETLDLTRRFATVDLDDVEVEVDALLSADGETAFALAEDLGVVLCAADAVGAAEYLLELTVEYAGDRIAFQRPIASYQAVKHMCADMLLHVEASRAACRYAALTLGANAPDRRISVSVAGGYAAEATADVAGDALQIHGGVGFTWEHDLHLFLRRIKVDQVLFGDSRWHREQVVRAIT